MSTKFPSQQGSPKKPDGTANQGLLDKQGASVLVSSPYDSRELEANTVASKTIYGKNGVFSDRMGRPSVSRNRIYNEESALPENSSFECLEFSGKKDWTGRIGNGSRSFSDDRNGESKLQGDKGANADFDKLSTFIGQGFPLPMWIQSFMGSRLGFHFEGVRIHTGANADHFVKGMNARALTIGNHVVLDQNLYKPERSVGLSLLAHELVHVVQQEARDPFATPQGRGSRLFIQRQACDSTSHSCSPEAEPPVLSTDARQALVRLTGDRIVAAGGQFSTAVTDNKIALKAVAAAAAADVALISEVAFGMLMPSLARGLARLIGKLPDFIGHVNFQPYKAVLLNIGQDELKQMVQGAGKVAFSSLRKSIASLPFEAEEEQFLANLTASNHAAFMALSDGLDSLSDAQLGAMYAAFDPEATNVLVYRESVRDLLNKYRNQVMTIGRANNLLEIRGEVVLIEDGVRGNYFALVRHPFRGAALIPDESRYEILTRISEEMVGLALERNKQIFGFVKHVSSQLVVK